MQQTIDAGFVAIFMQWIIRNTNNNLKKKKN